MERSYVTVTLCIVDFRSTERRSACASDSALLTVVRIRILSHTATPKTLCFVQELGTYLLYKISYSEFSVKIR